MRENFFRKVVVVFIFSFALFSCKAQCYEAKYKMIYQTSGQGNIADTLKNIQEVLRGLPIMVVVIYTVITDGKYLLLKGKEEGESTVSGASVSINLSDTEIICDLAKQLIYFPESGKLQRIKKYVLSKDTITGGQYSIEGLSNLHFAVLNDSLKDYVSPAVFFSNNKYGIQKIHTPDFTIELLGPVKRVDKKLSFGMFFKKVDKLKIKEEYSFF